MWSPMQKTLFLPHIRAMNFRSKFVEFSDHVSKLKFYHIENLILPHYESLTDFDPKKCEFWVKTRHSVILRLEHPIIHYYNHWYSHHLSDYEKGIFCQFISTWYPFDMNVKIKADLQIQPPSLSIIWTECWFGTPESYDNRFNRILPASQIKIKRFWMI